jgi:hypothetical protein
MSDAGDHDPRWGEREVGLILRRALELQHEEQRQAPGALQRGEGNVVPRAGATTIRVEERLAPGSLFGGMVGGGAGGSTSLAFGVGVGALHSPLAAAAIWLFSMGSAYAGARTLYRRTVRRRTEELQGVLARITEHLQSAITVAALPAAPASKALPPAEGE